MYIYSELILAKDLCFLFVLPSIVSCGFWIVAVCVVVVSISLFIFRNCYCYNLYFVGFEATNTLTVIAGMGA